MVRHVRNFLYLWAFKQNQHPLRCTADPTDLDGSPAEFRTLQQLLTLSETEDADTLWFGYGIVPDFLVCCASPPTSRYKLIIYASRLLRDSRAQTYTNFSPQTSSTKQSRGRSRTTSLHGSKPISTYRRVLLRVQKCSMRLIAGLPRSLINLPVQVPHTCPRIALIPLFPGLRRFKQGRNFQQWTGNDSKAFMKVSTMPILN
jgi:hypothetical protein